LRIVREGEDPPGQGLDDELKIVGGAGVTGASREQSVTGEEIRVREKADTSGGVAWCVEHLKLDRSQRQEIAVTEEDIGVNG